MSAQSLQIEDQPFFKLIRSNMEMLIEFSKSPQLTQQTAKATSGSVEQGMTSVANLFQSNAFSHLMDGMFKNYTAFLTDMGQLGMTTMAQGQTAILKRANEVTDQVVNAVDGEDRHARQKDGSNHHAR